MSTSISPKKTNGCPCCSFDLFLPPSERKWEETRTPSHPVDESREALPISDGNEQDLLSLKEVVYLLASISDTAQQQPLVVDTHGHAQLNRNRDETYEIPAANEEWMQQLQVRSLACAVEPADFQATLQYAATSTAVLPALGVHPWYIESLDLSNDSWLVELEQLLLEHQRAIVGEIGLCKIARWVRSYPEGKAAAMDIQRHVLKRQMELAAKLQRPVSVHCVNAHGMLVSVIKELAETSSLPPIIGMHSFTGTAHHIKELLDLEKVIISPSPSSSQPLFYFGFSHAVNFAMCTSEKSRQKGREAVQAVPMDRLMVESDVHNEQDVLGGTIGAIAYVAWAREASVLDIAKTTANNGLAFLGYTAR